MAKATDEALVGCFVLILILTIGPFATAWLWNMSMVTFGLPEIGWLEALVLMLLGRLLTG